MKPKLLFLSIIAFCGFLYSCEKDDIEFENKFEKSHKAWNSFKKSSGNNYRYTVTGNTWAGASWETTLTIKQGTVTQRDFKYTLLIDEMAEVIPKEELEWVEYEDEINTHNHSVAAEALTLDEVYEKAQNEWLIKRKGVKTSFEAENNGLLSTCGYVREQCMDDCFTGIRISNIVPLP